jgi:iron(III) transport system ATP-binding protein
MRLIELSRVSITYPNAVEPALHDLSLDVAEGATLSILGPSGCGKTTVLRAIAGFEHPSSGEIRIAGRVVCNGKQCVPPEERGVGMVFQDYALFPHLTVARNVAFGLRRLEPQAAARMVATTLDLVGLTDLKDRYPHELSGGQQQRVAIARALAPKPVVLLLDEPFSNLDPDMRGQMREEVQEILQRTGITAVLVTHDHDEAFAMADRIAVLNRGRLEQIDNPESIYHTPATPFVANFVGQADFLPGRVENGKIHTEVGVFENVTGHPSGTAVEIMIRPDDVHFTPASPGTAQIAGRQFRGSETLYTVLLPSGQYLHSSEDSTTVHPIGTSVEITIVATHIVTFVKR